MLRSGLAGLLLLFGGSAANATDASIYFIKDDGRRFSIEAIRVPPGQTEVITCGKGQEYVDVVFPPSVGGSASLAQADPPRRARTATSKRRSRS
ncbi:MAG: hypothetical protein HOP12_14800 [Candidatus Eisenbacteria bacterium]|uniref:Uncharacterized protein n=1 Tax=Eiseniibacteriota bacterium TaxID=2212470 RepID=A0A849SLU9_UNCEI|nr:hypothetical protein [Candidatus Eisenbacteria bacterium]